MKKRMFQLAVCAAVVLFSGCVSLMEKAGRALDGSAFAEKKINIYRDAKKAKDASMEIALVQNKSGVRSVILSMNEYPMMKLRGSLPVENGEFYLTSLEYLAGSVQGWNEYSLELLGEGTLFLGETAVLQLNEEIEPVQISSGRIQRYDTRITGSDALTSLRNRHERIVSTAEWMTSLEGAPKGQNLKDFEIHWKPVLFPEMVSKNKRPADWIQEGDQFIKADDINWNTSYTERLFSEELRPVRDSGTLLRDWEEALSWIYLEYEWENIIGLLSRQTTLQLAK